MMDEIGLRQPFRFIGLVRGAFRTFRAFGGTALSGRWPISTPHAPYCCEFFFWERDGMRWTK